jgi:hypothetical protein
MLESFVWLEHTSKLLANQVITAAKVHLFVNLAMLVTNVLIVLYRQLFAMMGTMLLLRPLSVRFAPKDITVQSKEPENLKYARAVLIPQQGKLAAHHVPQEAIVFQGLQVQLYALPVLLVGKVPKSVNHVMRVITALKEP